MSKIALSGNASGTGTFTIASPDSNSDRTVNLPDAGGDMVLTTATQTLTNKDIVATQLTGDVAAARITTALNASGSAPIYACRAWVNFDGTASPITLRGNGNVSSITDNGAGIYTVNFTTAMSDANYSVSGSTVGGAVNTYLTAETGGGTFSTSAVQVRASLNNGANTDTAFMSVQIFR
jgi:hypothetical protein